MTEQQTWLITFNGSADEQMGKGFESDVADELEGLADCYFELGEIEKATSHYTRAEQIREQL